MNTKRTLIGVSVFLGIAVLGGSFFFMKKPVSGTSATCVFRRGQAIVGGVETACFGASDFGLNPAYLRVVFTHDEAAWTHSGPSNLWFEGTTCEMNSSALSSFSVQSSIFVTEGGSLTASAGVLGSNPDPGDIGVIETAGSSYVGRVVMNGDADRDGPTQEGDTALCAYVIPLDI